MPRKVNLETTLTLKVNTGNFESFDVSKTISMEVEFETPDELVAKSAKMDNAVAALVKAEAEAMLEQLGRSRIMRINNVETPVELWKSYVKGA